MPAQSNLNFIPDSVVKERRLTKTKIAGKKFSIFMVVLTVIISIAIFWINRDQNKKIEDYKTKINQDNEKILSLKEFGEKGYILGIRLENIKNTIDQNQKISSLLNEVKSRTPQNINILQWSYGSDGNLDLKAEGMFDYSPIEKFNENLTKKDSDGKTLFNDVQLVSANYNKSAGSVSFSFKMRVDKLMLTNGVSK